MAYISVHTGATIDSTITKFKDEAVQSSAIDTTAGTIALQGNNADFAALTAETVSVGSYTVGTVPSASGKGAGAMIYVTNEIGGAIPAFSDGINWRRMSDRAIIS